MNPTAVSNATPPVDHVIRMKELMAGVGLSRSTIYEYVKAGLLPKPLRLGPRAVGWLASDVTAFIASRVLAARVQHLGSDIAALIDSRIEALRCKAAPPAVIAAHPHGVGGAA